jgi:hypothetical protein
VLARERPALVLPFRLRGYDGEVSVFYGVNDDAAALGFDLLELPFPSERAHGFPLCAATIDYAGPGYRAAMGWIQVVTVRDAATGEVTPSPDLYPMHYGLETPFAPFGFAPTFFDAPGPNPPRSDETWLADTFLTACPDVARTRRVAPLLAFRWGYELRAARPAALPIEERDLDAWTDVLPTLREAFPSWTFELLPL